MNFSFMISFLTRVSRLQGRVRPHRETERLCFLPIGHRHLQPAALLRLLHHHEGGRRRCFELEVKQTVK